MRKMLIINPALAPYRIDTYNKLAESFDLKVIFLQANLKANLFDVGELQKQTRFKYSYFLRGFTILRKHFRLGILNEIKKNKPDIVVGYEYSPITIWLIVIRKIYGFKYKLASAIDDNIEICNKPRSFLRGISRSLCLTQLDYLVLLSKEVADWYNIRKNIDLENIIISPIVHNPQKFTIYREELQDIARSYVTTYNLSNKKVILFVGRFVVEKGLKYFIELIPEIIKSEKNIYIVLIGNGIEKEAIEKMVIEYNISQYVLMPGRFEHLALYAWYKIANVFMLPSINETFGAVVNESLIFGTPVICSQYAGASTLIKKNHQGILIDPFDKSSFLSNTLKFLSKIEIQSNLNFNAKENLMIGEFNELLSDWERLQ